MEANGIGGGAGGAAWDPVIKKIVVGPGGYQRQEGCTIISTYLTDVWTFDPFTKSWAQVMPPDDAFQATAASTWFVDPVSGLAYAGTGGRNNSPIGAYLIDFSTAKPTKALVDNTWPFSTFGGTTAVDTTHHYVLQLLPNTPGSPSQVGLYNLNGLSMTKYGTNGSKGTNGLAGGSGPQFDADTSWTVAGDTTLLDYPHASLTYNPKIDMFVAWTGTSKVYFVQLNYSTKTATIISKQVPGGPSATYNYGGMAGHLIYIPASDEYLVYTGVNSDFWLLVPPTSTVGTQSPATPSVSGSVIANGQQVSTNDRLRVHSKAVPSAASTLCVQPAGAKGTVQYNPVKAYGYTFAKVKFATGCSGWVVTNYLSPAQ